MRKTKFHILAILLATMLMLTAFAAPALAGDTAFGTGIQITPPTGWTNRDANVTITITDTTGNGFVRAMVKGEGDWRDITSELEQQGREYTAVLTVSDNCTVTASVTGWDGQTYEKSCSIPSVLSTVLTERPLCCVPASPPDTSMWKPPIQPPAWRRSMWTGTDIPL